MKIIHLSDPHISPDKLFEHDAKERFSLALQHICNNHLDSKLFVISGDLTHDGDSESYNKLNEILLNSKIIKYPSRTFLQQQTKLDYKYSGKCFR